MIPASSLMTDGGKLREVDEDARLVGVVERNKLTSSILMQLVSDL